MAKRLPPRLEPDASGNYYAIYSEGGRSRRKSLRTKDLFRAEHRFEGWLEAKRKAQLVEDDPYVEDCLDYWMDQWIMGRMLSESRYPSVVNNLKAYFGKMRVSQITRKDSAAYIELRRTAQIGSNCASDSTINHEMTKLIAAFNFMRHKVEPRERRIDSNRIPFIEPCPKGPPRDRVLSSDELTKLVDHCVDLKISRNNPLGLGLKQPDRVCKVARFIMLAMETAQRKTAILELKWPQVNLDKKMIIFNPSGRHQTKKKRPPVPISPRLLPLLHRYYEERLTDYVCDTQGDVHEAVKAVGRDLQIEGLSPHVFRHTWASHAVERGVPIEKVAAFLGDHEETVRRTYVHLSPDYLKDVF